MALTTRCPHCGTAFKVVADQLRVRNGLVRCGVCTRVFDGYEAIVDEDMPVLAPAPEPVVPPAVKPQVPPVVQPVVPPAAPPWDTPVTPPVAPITPVAPATPIAPIDVREDISDAQLWAKEPVLSTEPPAVLRGRADAGRQEPTFIVRDEPEDEDEPFDDDDAAIPLPGAREPTASGPKDNVRHGPRDGLQHDLQHGLRDDPQVIRQRQRPIYVDPADDEYDDDLHGHPVTDADDRSRDDFGADRFGADRFGSDRFGSRVSPVVSPVSPASRDDHDSHDGHDSPIYIYPDRDHRADQDDDTGPEVYTPVRGDARTRYDDDVDAGMAPPVFMDESRLRRAALVRRLWAVGCLLALIALGLQGVYVYRSAVASSVPALRPALQSVCDALGCEVGYARRLERISITASTLQPPAGATATGDGITHLVLSVTLRNRFDKPQPWPALVLELTDLSDTVVVRKVLRPEDYLPSGTRGAFPAGGEQSLSVPLRIAGAQVNGYQLDKFFP